MSSTRSQVNVVLNLDQRKEIQKGASRAPGDYCTLNQ